MQQETLDLFRKLTEFPAASGFERGLRAVVKEEISKYTDEIIQDGLGSIFGVVRGNEEGPRVMVAGHLDEVGFMSTQITPTGMIKFTTLGGWWGQVVLAQQVDIITPNGPIRGVVGSIPKHLLDEATANKPVDPKVMYIDVGADSRADAEAAGIRPGQQIVPVCEFTPLLNPKKIMAKAWDNRYGTGLAIELLKEVHREKMQLPNILFSGATVQEEVGLRGARTAANLIQPDIFYGLDCSAANDMTGDSNSFGHLGKGALLRIFDPTMITHRGLIEFVQDIADTYKIPYQ